jgi:hypothetical protein
VSLDAYAGWLERLSEKDRQYVRDQHAEVALRCAADPSAPVWAAMYFAWTLSAIESENPAAALRQAVESEDSDPAEVCRALAGIDRTSREWAEWWPAWHPSAN